MAIPFLFDAPGGGPVAMVAIGGLNPPAVASAYIPYDVQHSPQLPSSVLTAWQPVWYRAQVASPNAGWNVPVLVVVAHPYAPLPASILTAWQPAWYASQTAAPVAPLALIYGQQPPAYSIVTVMEIRRAWEPPDPQPQRLYATQIVSVFPLLPIPCSYRPGRPDEGQARAGRPDEGESRAGRPDEGEGSRAGRADESSCSRPSRPHECS
jgi:hypothetical protein